MQSKIWWVCIRSCVLEKRPPVRAPITFYRFTTLFKKKDMLKKLW
jgi:hypothetical protein